ncbi:hypothetical protein DPMN_095003 [Dreissena polymorpha]|uniref:Uncharacterized protein n=1 Tax=Dreissena polymorpha TaxID=45954 RepID=A0A9D4R357_DREPO|nr:hypothetical protein DPMN_095003 [Dreissena polymorpha]
MTLLACIAKALIPIEIGPLATSQAAISVKKKQKDNVHNKAIQMFHIFVVVIFATFMIDLSTSKAKGV